MSVSKSVKEPVNRGRGRLSGKALVLRGIGPGAPVRGGFVRTPYWSACRLTSYAMQLQSLHNAVAHLILAPRKSFDILALHKSDYYYYYYYYYYYDYFIPSSVKIPRVKNKVRSKTKS